MNQIGVIMCFGAHWKRTEPYRLEKVEHFEKNGTHYFLTAEGNWKSVTKDTDLADRMLPGLCYPTDAVSTARRKRDLVVLGVVAALFALAGALQALRLGAPHQWKLLSSFAQKHPMAIAGPLAGTAIIGLAVLGGKRGLNKEVMTLLAISALLLLAGGTLHMEAPKVLKYILKNPQILAMPIAAYSSMRLVHHYVSKKKEEIEADRQGKLEVKRQEKQQLLPPTVKTNPFLQVQTENKRNRKVRAVNQKAKAALWQYQGRAALVGTVALIAIATIGLLGWPAASAKVGHFVKEHWAVPVVASGILASILWAQKCGSQNELEAL